MDRQGQIWSGAIILVIGVVVTLASIASTGPDGSFVMATGAVVVGLVRLVRGLGTQEHHHSHYRASHPPVPLGEDTAPAIAGAACALCTKTIESRLDGTACPTCQRPLHHDCKKPHVGSCAAGGGTYRS
jgi:hypothetical protein